MIWIVNILGVALILFIVGWFWMSKPATGTPMQDRIEVIVNNGVYSPAYIRAKQGQALTLVFKREDPSPCAEQVIFDKLNLSAHLPVGEEIALSVPTDKKGSYEFACQMHMYIGKLDII